MNNFEYFHNFHSLVYLVAKFMKPELDFTLHF